jgi:hypothetical protein
MTDFRGEGDLEAAAAAAAENFAFSKRFKLEAWIVCEG